MDLRSAWTSLGIFAAIAVLSGCSAFEQKKPAMQPLESEIVSPYRGVKTLAIAPAINLSGSREFDPLAVSDTLYEEMQQISGLNVLPLNRTLLAMRQLNIRSIDEPAEAQAIAESLGADGLIVPAVTAYDPYDPPTIGMILQMYTPRSGGGLNATTAPAGGRVETQPVSQATAVFNSTNQSVLRELRDFAQGRTQMDSALGEEKFLMDADLYMRFVCHAMARRLMVVERVRVESR